MLKKSFWVISMFVALLLVGTGCSTVIMRMQIVKRPCISFQS